ncbi:hypothetical protein AGMMS49959_02600 [Planctomycetales bacterium]|nr:hypothetical protein AGMMS49959_02600 [Planctomycetales bacterium]
MRRILLVLLIFTSCVLAQDDQWMVEIGEIVAVAGNVKITRAAATDDHHAVGEKIYAGDTIVTAANAAIEITCGLNVRLRLESNGEIRIQPLTATTKTVDEVPTTQQTYSLLLLQGALRTRVKQNVVTAQQVLIRVADLGFLLPRSDFLIVRAPGATNAGKMLNCALAWGRVELQLYNGVLAAPNAASGGASGDKNVAENFVNAAPGKLQISERPADNRLPAWQPLPADEAKKLLDRTAKFSVDVPLNLPREAPDDDPETQGA